MNLVFTFFKKSMFSVLIFFTVCISFTPKKSEMQSVPGKILESRVEKKHKFRSVYKGHNDFYPYVKYEYEVDGVKFYSERISYWNNYYNSQTKAESALSPYPSGKIVTVFYKKGYPKESYLEVEDDSKEEED